jgi:HSP20 family molecular chaperone IbpA
MEVADMGHAEKKMIRRASLPSTPPHSFLHPAFANDPSVSLWVGAKAMIVTAEIPGAEAGNVEVSVDGRQLILKKKSNGQGVDDEKVIDLPYRVDRSELEVHCDRGFVNVILKKEDERTLYNKTLLEAAIINTVSRYFNGHGKESTHPRKKEDQFLIQALQRYFKGNGGSPGPG